MKLLVSGSTATVRRLSQGWLGNLGQLLTPKNWNSVGSIILPWASDNGAFSGFDPETFRGFLRKIGGKEGLLWIACPDKVADAKTTLEMFGEWQEEVQAAGPVAFVGQDGQEDLAVPWDRFSCFFVGGSTAWKLSAAAADIISEAKQRGKWVHMGRVNTLRRLRTAHDLGCDSVDGSSFSRWGNHHIEKALRFMARLDKSPTLF